MLDQADAWGRVAAKYDDLFVDPYAEGGSNPVLRSLARLPGRTSMTIGDLGCGTGPLLPHLVRQFNHVVAVDFSEAMLAEAKRRCKGFKNISFHLLTFAELEKLRGKLDVAVSMNSLVSADVSILDEALRGMKQTLKPGGKLWGIVPSLEGLNYHVMLLTDLGLEKGMTLPQAQQFAAKKAELHGYDLNTATFTFDKIRQHLWLRIEVSHRLKKAGFARFQVRQASLPWDQFAQGKALSKYPPSWDWAFQASVAVQ